MSHSNVSTELAAGMKGLPDGGQSFSQTQALWRFLANDSISFEVLSEPLLDMAQWNGVNNQSNVIYVKWMWRYLLCICRTLFLIRQ
jgi:hypothetical protein